MRRREARSTLSGGRGPESGLAARCGGIEDPSPLLSRFSAASSSLVIDGHGFDCLNTIRLRLMMSFYNTVNWKQ